MSRAADFSDTIKRSTIRRQDGLCAFCGVPLATPWSTGDYRGYAHHLIPQSHGGVGGLENCVYLCWGHHLLIGHGMAPFGIDRQHGSSSTRVLLEPGDFLFWNGDRQEPTLES